MDIENDHSLQFSQLIVRDGPHRLLSTAVVGDEWFDSSSAIISGGSTPAAPGSPFEEVPSNIVPFPMVIPDPADNSSL